MQYPAALGQSISHSSAFSLLISHVQSGLKLAAWSSFSQSGGLLQSAASIYVDNNRHDQWIALRLSFKTELFSAVAQRAACHHLPGVCQLSITPAGTKQETGQAVGAQNCPVCVPALPLVGGTGRTRPTLSGKTPQTLKREFCSTGEELDPFSTWDRFKVQDCGLKGTDNYKLWVRY